MSEWKGRFEQDFNTTEKHTCDVLDPKVVEDLRAEVEQLIDQGLARIPDVPGQLDDLIKAGAKATAMTQLGIQLAIMVQSTPTPWFRTAVEGDCAHLASTTINLVNFAVDGVTALSVRVANIPVVNGISVAAKLKVQVNPGKYASPHHCSDSPAHLAWLAEANRVHEANERRRRTHEQWLRDLQAYKELLRKKGSAFDENGEPYPTPVWPEDVENIERRPPPPPPMGTYKVREFHVLWTLELEVGVAFFAGTLSKTLFDHIYDVRTKCCIVDGEAAQH